MSRHPHDYWSNLDDNEVARDAARADPVACVLLEVGKAIVQRLDAIVAAIEDRQ